MMQNLMKLPKVISIIYLKKNSKLSAKIKKKRKKTSPHNF